MMQRYTLYIALLLFTVTTISCGVDSDVFIPLDRQADIDRLFDDLKSSGEQFTANLSDSNLMTFVTTDGIISRINVQSILQLEDISPESDFTISIFHLDNGKEVFRNDIVTTIDKNGLGLASALRYEIYINGNKLEEVPLQTVEFILPSTFDDGLSAHLSRYDDASWSDVTETSRLASGNFEILIDDATIWSDFGYSLYAEPNQWYGFSMENLDPVSRNYSVCVEGDFDFSDSRVYLVGDTTGEVIRLRYSTITEKFCQEWYSVIEERSFTMYAFQSVDGQLFNVNVSNLSISEGRLEVDLFNDLDQIEKESLIALLKQ